MARILLIDDEEDLVDLIRFDLERRGHTVETSSDGDHALEILKNQTFDLVITDLKMPGTGGLGICQELRLNHRSTAIIVLSGYSDVELELDALGITNRLRKPFPLAALANLITQLTS
jgi:DNA-binding response OmpR family regulator